MRHYRFKYKVLIRTAVSSILLGLVVSCGEDQSRIPAPIDLTVSEAVDLKLEDASTTYSQVTGVLIESSRHQYYLVPESTISSEAKIPEKRLLLKFIDDTNRESDCVNDVVVATGALVSKDVRILEVEHMNELEDIASWRFGVCDKEHR